MADPTAGNESGPAEFERGAQGYARSAAVASDTTERGAERGAEREEASHETLRAEHQRAVDELRAHREMTQVVMESLGEGVYVLDRNGLLTFLNPAGQRLLGWTESELLGKDMHGAIHSRHADGSSFPKEECPLTSVIRSGATVRTDYDVFTRKDGTLIPVTYVSSPIRSDGAVTGAVVAFHDISRRAQAERRLSAQYRVSQVLLESATLEEAAPRMLEAIGDDLDWELGALWMVDVAGQALHPTALWHAAHIPDEDFETFARATRGERLLNGVGLPGRVWESSAPAWVEELAGEDNFPRLRIVGQLGLTSAFAFPVCGRAGVLGAIEFFSRQPHYPDRELQQTTTALGNQLGQFIEHHRAEEATRASEARMRAIVESALDSVVTIDAQGRLLEFNPAAERTFGYQRDEVLGQSMPELIIPPSMRAAHYAGMERYLAIGKGPILGRRVEMTAMRADGSEFPVEMAITRIEPSDPTLFTAYLRDITERKQVEREFDALLLRAQLARADAETATARLRATQLVTDTALLHLDSAHLLHELIDRIRMVLNVDNAAILLLDPTRTYLAIHAARGPEEAIAEQVRVPLGEGFAGRIAATRQPMVVDDVSRVEVSNPFLREQIRSLVGVPLVAEGHVLGVLHIGTIQPHHFTEDDVRLLQLVADRVALAIDHARLFEEAARSRVEAMMRAGELEATFQSMAEGVFVCDAQGRLTQVNATGAGLFGLTPEEAMHALSPLGETPMLCSPDGEVLAIDEYPLARALAGQTHTDLQYIIRPQGEATEAPGMPGLPSPSAGERYVRVSCAPINTDEGEVLGALAVISDITELYRLERQKDEFMSIASHELKTPLTSLKILAQLLRRRFERLAGQTGEAVRQFERMDRAIERMERLINDLLDVTRIEAGKLALNRERMDLARLVEQVAEEQAAATEREIRVEIPPDEVMVQADMDRIAQVLANLISNALKYSAAIVPVDVRVVRTDGEAIVTVHDRGPGIVPEALEHIFERFYRVPGVEVLSGSGVGLGLGLYISSELVERHGGRIWAESAVGEGTTFSFALPIDLTPDPLP